MDIKIRWADNTKELAANLAQGVNQIEATKAAAEKMTQSLQGDKLIQSARTMAAAIQQVGGTTTLTAAQMERANTLFQKAGEKLQLTGQGATYAAQTFKDLAAQTKPAVDQLALVAKNLQAIGRGLTTIGTGLTAGITAPLLGFAALSLKASTDFESAFAGVRKTVSGTPAELQAINEQFRAMAKETPVSAAGLAKIGEMAGQLGVQKDKITSFTKTIVDISVATNLTADEAGSAFARLANVMKMPQDQFSNLGSAVVALGNFGASTEQEMLSMAQRISAAGATAGFTAPQVLGIANALSSVGIEAEAGGTAVSRVINKIGSDVASGSGKLQVFAKVAGLSAAEFQKAWHDDAGTAFTQFMQGLANARAKGGDELLGLMDELGFKEVRLRNAFMASANAGTLMADSIKLGTQAFNENTELARASEERYKTFANQVQVLWNNITDVAITFGQALTPTMIDAIKAIKPLVAEAQSLAEKFKDLPEPVRLTGLGIGGLAVAAGPAVYFTGQLAGAITNLIPLLQKLQGMAAFSTLAGLGLGAAAAAALTGGLAVAIIAAFKGIEASEINYRNRTHQATVEAAQAKLDEAGINKKLTASIADLALAQAINNDGAKAAMVTWGLMTAEVKKTEAATRAAGTSTLSLLDKVKALTEEEKTSIATDRQKGLTVKQIAVDTGIAADVVGVFVKQQEKAEKQATKTKKEYDDWKGAVDRLEDQFDGMNWDYTIDGALKLGGSIKDIALYFGVSVGEVRNHKDAIKIWADVAKIEAGGSAADLIAKLEKLGRVIPTAQWTEAARVFAKVGEMNAKLAEIPTSLERIGQEFKREINPELDRAILKNELWHKSMATLSGAFGGLSGEIAQIAQISGGTFSNIVKDIGLTVKAAEALTHALEVSGIGAPKIAEAGSGVVVAAAGTSAALAGTAAIASHIVALTAAWAAVAIAVYSVVSAISEAAEKDRQLTARKNFGQKLAEGFQTATQFSEALRDSVLTTAGALDVQARTSGSALGKIIEQALAARHEMTALDGQNNAQYGDLINQLAEALHVSDEIKELGGVSALTTGQIAKVGTEFKALIGLITLGGPLGAQATEELDKSLVQFGESAVKSGGFVSQMFLDTVRDAKKAGIELANTNAFIVGQLQNAAAPGLAGLIGGLQGSAVAKFTRPLVAGGMSDADAAQRAAEQGVAFDVTAAQATGLSAAVAATFNDMTARGVSFRDALSALQVPIDGMRAALTKAGLSGGDAFNTLAAESEIAGDAVTGPLVDGITSARKALTGLNNSGLLTQSMFGAITASAAEAYNQIIAQGKDGTAAMAILRPTLQTIWEAEQKFGYTTDEATQALVDQAVASGQVGEQFMSAQDKMAAAMDRTNVLLETLVTTLGGTIPAAAAAGAKGVQNALNGIQAPDLTVRVGFDDRGGYRFHGSAGVDGDVPTFASGVTGFRGGWAIVGEDGPELLKLPAGSDVIPSRLTPQGNPFGAVADTLHAGATQARDMVFSGAATAAGQVTQITLAPSFPSVFPPNKTQIQQALNEYVWPELPGALNRDYNGERKAITKIVKG